VGLLVVSLAIIVPCLYVQAVYARAMGSMPEDPAFSAASDPAIRRRLRQYGVGLAVLGLLAVGAVVWLAIPGHVVSEDASHLSVDLPLRRLIRHVVTVSRQQRAAAT
jgi:hypothetical protein